MKIAFLFIFIFVAIFISACDNVNNKPANKPTNILPTPVPTNINPVDGTYPGKGKVTKIDKTNGSVELDHEDIPGLMPKMIMEFYVKDKKLLEGLSVGESVDFTVEYKQGTEKISSIKKSER